jgi:hypothetical protein
MPNKSRIQTAKDWLTVLFLGAGFICLVLVAANMLSIVLSRPVVSGHIAMTEAELTTILFGASSTGLILFSLLLAGAAIIDWRSLKREIETALERATEATRANDERVRSLETIVASRLLEIETELRGRVDAVMGAMIGTLHSKPDADLQDEEALDYISEAIYHIRAGYDRLKGSDVKGKYMALNNLVYFSCMMRAKEDQDETLQHGRELLEVGRQNRHLAYASPYLLTYCRVILVYSSNRDEIEQAAAIATNLQEKGLTKLQRREANYLVASLTSKLAKQ